MERDKRAFVRALGHAVLVGLFTIPGSLEERRSNPGRSVQRPGSTLLYQDDRTLEEKLFGAPSPDNVRIRGWLAVVKPRHGYSEYVSLGRGPHNDIVLGDRSVSKDHARVYRSSGASVLVDVGSSNGTWHNQLRIDAMEHVEVHPGDEIQFGRVVCAYLSPGLLREYLLDKRSPRFN